MSPTPFLIADVTSAAAVSATLVKSMQAYVARSVREVRGLSPCVLVADLETGRGLTETFTTETPNADVFDALVEIEARLGKPARVVKIVVCATNARTVAIRVQVTGEPTQLAIADLDGDVLGRWSEGIAPSEVN